MGVLNELQPRGVWRFFEDLCGIPHGSYNEKGVSDYCVAFAKERGLQVYQDQAYNVVIIKPASAGYEEAEPIILQGHLDMVCEKDADCDIDFEKDGLRLKVDGDYVCAEGTTLGGDDGIAVAYALAILDDDTIPHPRLEVIFTTAEEVGMEGAMALNTSMLKGHVMLNMDSEEEGILLAGCAGGSSTSVHLPVERESCSGTILDICVGGLLGGHSGAEIHKGRGNANLLMASVLGAMQGEDFCLISMAGGSKDNAITRECHAQVVAEDAEKLLEICQACEKGFYKEYGTSDPGLFVKAQKQEKTSVLALTRESTRKAVALILGLPNGVQRMSQDVEGLVETSLNLGVLKLSEEELELHYAVRSSVGEAKERLNEKIRLLSECLGAEVTCHGNYPAWEFKKESQLRDKMVRIYEKMFGKTPTVEAIHAGLECGLLSEKIPNMDCVSIGPEMHGVHTTNEKISISSVERMWNYILKILEEK